MEKYICACPMCSKVVSIKNNTPIGYKYKCKKCNSTFIVTPTGDHNTLSLSLYLPSYVLPDNCKKCVACKWADKSNPKYLTDILSTDHIVYSCKRDIRDSFDGVSTKTFRAYCDKEADLKMDANKKQTCSEEEIKNYGLSIVCRNIKQKDIILNLCKRYAKLVKVSYEINHDLLAQLPAYYNNHTATVCIKFKSKKVCVRILTEKYDPPHCISYYTACYDWSRLSLIYNSILNNLNGGTEDYSIDIWNTIA